MKRIVVICLFFFSLVLETAAQKQLTIIVDGFKEQKGKLMVGVYDSDSTFMKKVYKGYAVDVTDTSLEFTIELPEGEYAISVFHDVNENGKLDTGVFGIPTESYGFSNNRKGFMGPPSFEKAKFSFSRNARIRINLTG
ncbi:hypothetical protein FACS1894123_02420 [Bacteroidia bacterium]|nr:hypothetical protein FACS1894123_02420 [Bacteroidia bacterium]